MRNPHVKSMRYRVVVDEAYARIEDPSPLDLETEGYRMHLEGDVLTVMMKEHHATSDSARRRVEDHLRAWELVAALSHDSAWLKFDHDPAGDRIIDLEPPRPGYAEVVLAAKEAGDTARIVATSQAPVFKEYPRPPAASGPSQEAEALVRRFREAVRDDGSQLLSVGYACLTWLEGSPGRKAAAKQYHIDFGVLARVGDWTANRGGPGEARKLGGSATLDPLTPEENAWLREAIRMLLRRKILYDGDPATAASLPKITMADLPKL
jgi:hypothetical protein